MIKCDDVRCLEALGDCDHRGVHCTKTEICIRLDQLRRTFEVSDGDVFDLQAS